MTADGPGGGLAVGATSDGAAAARASASVILARGGARTLEVLMLERDVRTEFAGGALVFPGGTVTAADSDPRYTEGVVATPVVPSGELDAALGVADRRAAVALSVAAVREVFEEVGVLLGRHRDGARVDAAFVRSPPVAEVRQRLAARGSDGVWAPWLEERGLVLDLPALAFAGRWVTPQGVARRYDTRFFVAPMPSEQDDVVGADGVEASAVRWLTPPAALDAGERGEATVVFPTRHLLRDLAGFASADDLVAAARAGRTDRRRLEPTLVRVGDRVLVQHPDGGDPEPG